MSEGERVGHRGVRGGGREEIRSRVGPTTDFSTTREKSACPSPVRNPGRASDVRRGALPFLFSPLVFVVGSILYVEQLKIDVVSDYNNIGVMEN
jgi:hypothetical protein